MVSWFQFMKQHWIVGGMLVSLLWFLAGRQSLRNGAPSSALFWQGVGLFIAAVLCVWAVRDGEWIGVACGIALLGIEAFSVRRSKTLDGRDL